MHGWNKSHVRTDFGHASFLCGVSTYFDTHTSDSLLAICLQKKKARHVESFSLLRQTCHAATGDCVRMLYMLTDWSATSPRIIPAPYSHTQGHSHIGSSHSMVLILFYHSIIAIKCTANHFPRRIYSRSSYCHPFTCVHFIMSTRNCALR